MEGMVAGTEEVTMGMAAMLVVTVACIMEAGITVTVTMAATTFLVTTLVIGTHNSAFMFLRRIDVLGFQRIILRIPTLVRT
jgi:hypothetical protein